ncbi:MAG: pilus assembly protein PilM [Ectothiorhodospiraceae bacterium]|nr:pilus assembly protein PilM [Ectothiorhodospiraceae bacterium]
MHAQTLPEPSAPLARLTRRLGAAVPWASATPGPVGLDLGQDALHLVQVERGSAGVRLRAAASVEYEGGLDALLAAPRELRRVVARGLARGRFRGRRVVTCMPTHRTRLLLLGYRVEPDQDDGAAVLAAAAERLQGSIDEWVVDYVPVGAADPETPERTALLVAARRVDVIELLDRLAAGGLTVAALEVGPVAIRRLISASVDGDTHTTTLVVNIGRARSYLTVVSGRRLILDREVGLGADAVVEQVASTLELPVRSAEAVLARFGVDARAASEAGPGGEPEVIEALGEIVTESLAPLFAEVDRVRLYTAAHTRGAPVDRALLHGAAARWPGCSGLLERRLDLPVAPLDPFAIIPGAPPASAGGPSATALAVAAGCALWVPEG